MTKETDLLFAQLRKQPDIAYIDRITDTSIKITLKNPVLAKVEIKNEEVNTCSSVPRDQQRSSYCSMHKTFPNEDEPCWACVKKHVKQALDDMRCEIRHVLEIY